MMKRAILFVGLMIIATLLFCGMSYAEGSNYEGIDWDLTDGVLSLENGVTQTLLNNTDRIQTDWPWWESRQSITSVVCNGRLILNGSLRGMFMSCENAMSIDVSGFDTSGVTNMLWLFYGCKKVTSLSVNHFDMQNVTSIQGMFEQCTGLESIDVSNWDTSNIETMSRVFYYCSNLASITGISSWNTSSVTWMDELFYACRKLISLDLSSWDTSRVLNISGMFSGCSSLTSLNVSTWVTSSFSSLRSMFSNCSSLTTLDVSGWDVSSVPDMGLLFSNCKKLESLDLSGWRTNSLTYMAQMFDGCEALTTIGDVSQWDVSRVTTMSSLFNKCKALQSIDVSSWDTGRVTSMSSLFCECSSLSELAVSNWNTASVTYMAYMFRECSGLTSLDLSRWNTSHVTSMSHMFWNCSGLTELNVSGWNTGAVTNMDGMFYYCKNVDTLDVAGFDTSFVTNMKDMFSSCESVTELNVTRWDTSEVTNMSSMFARCHAITSLDLSNWNVSKVLYMGVYGSNSIGGGMFSHCVSLESINMSGWETDSLTSTQAMFAECTSLKVLDVSHLNMMNVDKCQSMFAQSGIVNIDVSMWNLSQSTNLYRMFAMCKDLQLANVAYLVRSGVTCVREMFWHCDNLLSLDLSTWDTSTVTDMRDLFYNDHELKSLNISSWDTSSVTSMAGMYYTNRLSEVELGLHNPFKGAGNTSITLPKPPTSATYTGKWIREDRTFGPYTPEELRDNYTAAMMGKWVWEKAPTDYTLSFVCTEEGYVGEMPQVTVLATEDYELPGNTFFVFGKVFTGWTDGSRRIYQDKDIIPANTYLANTEVTLTAMFVPRDTSIQMQNGQFTFSIKGDEKAFFDNVPAGTSYQIFEENIPEDWVLIMQSDGTGVITSLTESEAIFVNKYQPDLATIQFTGRKLMDEQPAEADSFTFELWEGNILLQTKSVIDGGFVQFDILEYGKNDVGIHTYTIKELIGIEDSVLYDGHEETIVVEVTSNVGEDNIVQVSAEVTYSEGTYPDIVFQNWTKPGELTLKKLVDDLLAGHEGDEFRFRIRFVQENGLPLSEELTYSIEP